MTKYLLLLNLLLISCAHEQTVAFSPAVKTDAQYRAQIHTELGTNYFSRGQYSVALEELTEAIKSDSNYAPAYNVLGLVYMELKEDALAEKNFEHAINISPLDSDALNNYGWFICQRKPEIDPIKYFLTALKNPLYTSSDKTLVNAGICSAKRGDTKNAEEYFHRALLIQPNQSQALYYLAELAYKRANYTQAKSFLSKNMQIVSPSAEVLWLGTRIERKLGDRNTEASYSVQLRKRYPDSKEAKALLSGQYE